MTLSPTSGAGFSRVPQAPLDFSEMGRLLLQQFRERDVVLKTSFDYPPIPDRQFDWSALDSNTYDADYDYDRGGYVSSSIVGHGRTEAEAIADFWEQWRERYDAS